MIKHVYIDMQRALEQETYKQLAGCIVVDGYTLKKASQVKRFFEQEIESGRKLLPMGECDNFDYQLGCKGHEEKKEGAK